MTPVPDLDTLILQNLARNPSYGYRIAQDILAIAPVHLENQESALYPALYQLELDGLLESYEQQDREHLRRYYRLTDKGQGKVVKAQATQPEKVVDPALAFGGHTA